MLSLLIKKTYIILMNYHMLMKIVLEELIMFGQESLPYGVSDSAAQGHAKMYIMIRGVR